MKLHTHSRPRWEPPSLPFRSFRFHPAPCIDLYAVPAKRSSEGGWGGRNELRSAFVQPAPGQTSAARLRWKCFYQHSHLVWEITNPGGMFAIKVSATRKAAVWLMRVTQNNAAGMNIMQHFNWPPPAFLFHKDPHNNFQLAWPESMHCTGSDKHTVFVFHFVCFRKAPSTCENWKTNKQKSLPK